MRHLKSGSKLGRNPWHRRATLRNLVTNLLDHGRITTTLTRAKAARPIAEKIITLGKRDTLAVAPPGRRVPHDAARDAETLLRHRSEICRSRGRLHAHHRRRHSRR